MLLVQTASPPYSFIRLIRLFRHLKMPPSQKVPFGIYQNSWTGWEHRCPASRPPLQGAVPQELILQKGLAPGEPEVPATIATWPRAAPGWEVRLFSTTGKSHMSRRLAQLRAVLAGACALTAGTCASLCPYLSAIRLGVLPASNTHRKPSLVP